MDPQKVGIVGMPRTGNFMLLQEQTDLQAMMLNAEIVPPIKIVQKCLTACRSCEDHSFHLLPLTLASSSRTQALPQFSVYVPMASVQLV